MLIAIIGTRCSGKSTVKDYLVSTKGFVPITILKTTPKAETETFSFSNSSSTGLFKRDRSSDAAAKHLSFLSMDATPLISSFAELASLRDSETVNGSLDNQTTLEFSTAEEVLEHMTMNWRTHFVTTDINTRDIVELFLKRPFFMLLCVDAPLHERFKRCAHLDTLEQFVKEDDRIRFGTQSSSIAHMRDLVNITIMNAFPSVSDLYDHLESLDVLNPSHLRPDWDTYFMTLASLASHRSNCMKRRVGAILVRDKRIVSTGYNGTPRHLRNCNEGGCPHCNGVSKEGSIECLCLHAEENALLEVGRERVGEGAVLYCNTCPCLKCTIKIIQTGVTSVVYNLTYKMDDASARLFQEAGIELRRYDPNHIKSRLPALDGRLPS